MRPGSITLTSVANTGTVLSPKIDGNQLFGASFQAILSDNTSAGTLQLQSSNDPCGYGNLVQDFTPVNWINVPVSTSAVTVVAGTTQAVVYIPQNYVARFYRVSWVSTAGAGTITVNLFSMGA